MDIAVCRASRSGGPLPFAARTWLRFASSRTKWGIRRQHRQSPVRRQIFGWRRQQSVHVPTHAMLEKRAMSPC